MCRRGEGREPSGRCRQGRRLLDLLEEALAGDGGGGTGITATVFPGPVENPFAEPDVELRYSESTGVPSKHLAKPAWDWLRQIARDEYERLRSYEHVEMMDADDLRELTRDAN